MRNDIVIDNYIYIIVYQENFFGLLVFQYMYITLDLNTTRIV